MISQVKGHKGRFLLAIRNVLSTNLIFSKNISTPSSRLPAKRANGLDIEIGYWVREGGIIQNSHFIFYHWVMESKCPN